MGFLDAIENAYNAVDDWGKQQGRDIGEYFTNPQYVSQHTGLPGGPAVNPIQKGLQQHWGWTGLVPSEPPAGSVGASGGTQQVGAATGKSSGGGGKTAAPGGHPILDYIRSISGNPNMSNADARKLRDEYQMSVSAPGLSQYVRDQTAMPDANTMQMFFAKTVAPYLQKANDQYNQGVQGGTQAMMKILGGSAGSPALDVLKAYLPMEQAGANTLGGAMQAATITAPYYDQLLTQLQNNVQEKQRQAALENQLISARLYGGSTAGTGGTSFGQSVVAGNTPATPSSGSSNQAAIP